jgi:hypothetical protein
VGVLRPLTCVSCVWSRPMTPSASNVQEDLFECADAPPDPWAEFDMNAVGMGDDDFIDAPIGRNDDYE